MQVRVCMCVFVWRLPFQRDVLLRSWSNRIPRATRSSFTAENDLLYASHVSVIRSRRKTIRSGSVLMLTLCSKRFKYCILFAFEKDYVHFKCDFICAFYRWRVVSTNESSIIFKLIHCVLLNSPFFSKTSVVECFSLFIDYNQFKDTHYRIYIFDPETPWHCWSRTTHIRFNYQF